MRGPKVIQHEIDQINISDKLTNRLHHMFVRLLNISAIDSYRQIAEYRTRIWNKKQQLIRNKKKAIRMRR